MQWRTEYDGASWAVLRVAKEHEALFGSGAKASNESSDFTEKSALILRAGGVAQ